VVRQWGSVGQGDGQFNHPAGLAVDSEHIYVSDCWNHRIQVFAKGDGAFVRQWGSVGQGDGQFNHPAGLAVDSEHIYVSDWDNHRIQVFR
jgi:DNA-binding beta-propeller fold protein YncE